MPDQFARTSVVDFPSLAKSLEIVLPSARIATDRLRTLCYGIDASSCSTRRMGLGAAILSVATACAEGVIVPPEIWCCAFAGDKGFTRPEMNAHALRTLPRDIDGCTAGYSTSHTCEIGLTAHGGVNYRSIAALLDSVARPSAANEGRRS